MSDGRRTGSAPSGDSDDDGNGDENGNGGDEGSDDGVENVPPVEKAVMALSALFTVSLFAFVVWQSFTGAGAVAPTVDVIGQPISLDDGVVYTVELRNPGDVGLVQATVEAGCADPPIDLVFENVPSRGRRVGTIVCPSGTTDPRVSIDSWIRE